MRQSVTIKEMLEEERPYEKCYSHGAGVLSDTELLAVLLRTGTQGMNSLELARTLLYPEDREEGILNIHHLTFEKLKTIKGIGDVKAIQILCLSELAKRLAKASAKEGLMFQLPATVAEY